MATHISNKIQQALNLIESQPLASDIWHILEEQHFVGFLPHFAVNHLCQKYQLEPKSLALNLLPIAACYSHAPISHFYVGAVVIGKVGDFYFGANQEFTHSHIQQTIHAEQSAIANAWIHHEKYITDVVVNYTPCGHCRQFMNELNSAEALKIHLPHSQNNLLHQYLPDAFGPKDLNIPSLLLDPACHHLTYATEDKLIQLALKAANMSHAPYSHCLCGVALQTKCGEIFQGSYAENAAFNPSLPALQVALNNLLLSGRELDEITRVVMLEKASTLSYRTMAEELLASLNLSLEYIAM